MHRTLLFLAALTVSALPATAWADVTPRPIPFMSVDEAIVIGSVVLGIVLSVVAFRAFRGEEVEDDQSSSQ